MYNVELIPVEKKSYIDARIYYVFELNGTNKLFDVILWGGINDYKSLFVNGIEIEENSIFFDVMLPFLSEEETTELNNYFI